MKLRYFVFLLLVTSCVDADLRKSVFLPDPELPELPAYSEWGLNTFGAFIDRQAFVSNDIEMPAKIIRQSGTTSLLLSGQTGSGDMRYTYPSATFSMRFVLPTEQSETYDDLLDLHTSTWDLTTPGTMVIFSEGVPDTVQLLSGTLRFARAQYLLVDEVPRQVILSGFFELKASKDGVPLSVTDGRFDVGIGEHNFFLY